MKMDEYDKGIDFMLYLQNSFGMHTVFEIWPDSNEEDWHDPRKTYNYYWAKWNRSGRNAVYFYNSFVKDSVDQMKMKRWYRNKMKELEH